MAISRRTKGLRAALAALLLGSSAAAAPALGADEPGAFDYWILALSWGPQHCQSEPADAQCRQPHGFVVHGLWPQHERGYPDFCGERSRVPDPLVDRMLPLMPSAELIQQQWRKHGSCSGMDVTDYFLNVERAWRRIVVPPLLRDTSEHLRTSLTEIESAFLAVNPALEADSIAVQCNGRWLREVRVCLNREFQPRICGRDVDDRCRADVHVRPIRERALKRR